MLGIAGYDTARDNPSELQVDTNLLAQVVELAPDAASSIIGTHHDVGAVVPGAGRIVAGLGLCISEEVLQVVLRILKVEVGPYSQAHSYGFVALVAVESDHAPLGELRGHMQQFALVIEISRIGGRERFKLKSFKRLAHMRLNPHVLKSGGWSRSDESHCPHRAVWPGRRP